MCDNMPMPKDDVTCPYCWWRGARHPYRWDARPCPRCGAPVSSGWLFKPYQKFLTKAAVDKYMRRYA